MLQKYISISSVLITLFLFNAFGSEGFHFAILGDRSGGANQEEFEKVVENIAQLHPDFVVTVGDMPEDGALAKDWVAPLQTLKQLDCPIYFTPGNHCLYDSISAKVYEQNTGQKPYYSFDYKNTHFIILNNAQVDSYDEIEPDQIKWLVKDLAKNQKAKKIFVFMHKPFWVENIAVDKEDKMHELFKKNGVDVVITGHYHHYITKKIDGITYFMVGSSGGAIPFENIDLGYFYHFLWCTIKKDKLHVSVIKSGNIFNKDFVSFDEYKLTESVWKEKLVKAYGTYENNNDTKLTISIENRTKSPISNNLFLKCKGNWKVSDSIVAVKTEPGKIFQENILLSCQGDFFPLPSVEFIYPISKCKEYKFKNTIFLWRTIASDTGSEMPVIDGEIKDQEWKNAGTINTFADFDGLPSKVDKTVAYLMHDSKHIYFAVKCYDEKMDSIKAKITERDGHVYTDDAVALFTSVRKDESYKIYVNSLGTVWDSKTIQETFNDDLKWNGDFEIKTKQFKEYWSVEMKMQSTQYNIVPEMKELRVNVRRKQQRKKASALIFPAWNNQHEETAILKL